VDGLHPPPPARQGAEYESPKGLVATFTRLHPKIHIRMEYMNNDYAPDPPTSAVQTFPKIGEMADRMLAAEAKWLPQFHEHASPR
jgi:hypothetical protein